MIHLYQRKTAKLRTQKDFITNRFLLVLIKNDTGQRHIQFLANLCSLITNMLFQKLIYFQIYYSLFLANTLSFEVTLGRDFSTFPFIPLFWNHVKRSIEVSASTSVISPRFLFIVYEILSSISISLMRRNKSSPIAELVARQITSLPKN